jgi:hypothetical protein
MKALLKTFGINNDNLSSTSPTTSPSTTSTASTPVKSQSIDVEKFYENVTKSLEIIASKTEVRLHWKELEEIIGCSNVSMKFENFQLSGSFEFRGSLFYLSRKLEELKSSMFIVQDYCGIATDHCVAFAHAAKVLYFIFIFNGLFYFFFFWS